MGKTYDCAIIGGGAVGAAAAYKLAHYEGDFVLLEAGTDVCSGASKANSGIVHGGFHYSAAETLKGKLELKGNRMFDELQRDLHFPFVRCGILVAAFTEEELATVRNLYERGKSNGVPGIELCSGGRMRELEKKLPESVCGGLYAPEGGVIEPYLFVFSLVHAAKLNGVDVRTGFRAARAEKNGEVWKIHAENGESVSAKRVINAAGLFADEVSAMFGGEKFRILARKGEEYLLDRLSPARPERILFPVPSAHTKGVLVIPTAGGTTMIGPTAQIVDDKTDTSTTGLAMTEIFSRAGKMVGGISARDLITAFSGSRPVMEGHEDFMIQESESAPGLIQAAGIQSPGLTASPAIAEMLFDLLEKSGLVFRKKEKFHLPEAVPAVRELTPEQVDELHKKDPAWSNIICRCEKVSEAEIRHAIRQGHTTLDGIKLATRAGMGRCQSGFCTLKIMKLLAEETGKPLEELLKGESGSRILAGKEILA